MKGGIRRKGVGEGGRERKRRRRRDSEKKNEETSNNIDINNSINSNRD